MIIDQDQILDQLCKLLPAQVETILFRLRMDPSQISASTAPARARAIEIIRYAEQRGQLEMLDGLILSMLGRTVVSPDAAEGSRFSRQLIEIGADDTVHVFAGKGPRVILPRNLPGLSSAAGKKAIVHASYWKRVYTLTEQLYPGYAQLYLYMTYSLIPSESEERKRDALVHLNAIQPWIKSFSDGIDDLPPPIRRAKPVSAIRQIALCTGAIKQSLASPPASVGFENGRILVERIGAWLLGTLHIADLVLERYFCEQEASK